MATSLASVPSYALPGVSAIQQPRAGLDSGDSSLATEILPGPPSLATVQQAAIRRDPRKPTPLVSYLPQHDPGTTYSGTMSGPAMGSLEALPEVDGPRRKRARVEKIHHIQRHSTRALNASSPSMEDTVMDDVGALEYVEVPESEPLATTLESDGADASRSTSLAPVDGSPSDRRNARPARRDTRKGKQKEETIGDKGGVRVKEEASVTTLHFGEPASAMRNEDHCSACRSLGSLVYCDGCTRAYHLLCLDPPMDAIDVPEDENRWFCPSCDIRRNPRPKPPKSILSPLIQHIENTPPTEFQLPDDVRMFYKHVGSNVRGAYVDTSSIKPPRLNRLGQLEDRDPYRTRDRNGAPVLCFQCGSSAIPESSTVIAPASKRPRRSVASASRNEDVEQWKSIVSCDYCSAHWHLDCLNPPLISMPPFDKKWMCPNHVDNTLRPRHRIPKQAAPVAEVTHPGARNNGNIEVSEPQGSVTVANVPVDEVFINGRRYRVPERIIKLDFWNKITNAGISDASHPVAASAMSSPLTSLSSLEDVEMNPPAPITLPSALEIEDLRLALLLLDMRKTTAGPRPNGNETKRAVRSEQAGTSTGKLQPQAVNAPSVVPNASVPQLINVKVEDDGIKPERKQPARASKKEVKYIVSALDGVDSDEGFISKPTDGQGLAETNGHAGSSKPRKPGRPRQVGKHRASTSKPTRSTKDRAVARPLDNSTRLEPESVPVSWPRTNGGQGDGVVKPAQSPVQNATPSLKIRLPRLSGLNLTPTSAPKAALPEPSTPVPKLVGTRPRRSLRRQNSAAASSSTSVSKLDAESKGASPECAGRL